MAAIYFFKCRCGWVRVYNLLRKSRKGFFSVKDQEALKARAHRVAWRQLLRWIQSQVAMIECGMAEHAEIFLPYLQMSSGQSLFEALKGGQFKAIAAPEVQ